MKIRFNGKNVSVKKDCTVRYLLHKLGINPEIFLVKKNGSIVHENETLRDKDRVETIKIISGG